VFDYCLSNIETSRLRSVIMTHRGAAVASRAIELALRGESFTADDIRRGVDDSPSRSTIYRVLRQLASCDWIEQQGNGWHPSVKAQLLRGSGSDDAKSDRRGSFEIDIEDIV